MPHYVVRVELDTEDAATLYPLLQEKMRNVGFSQNIAADDGQRYQLPDGLYTVQSDLSVADVKEVTRQVASTVGKNWVFALTVTDWSGYLERVTDQPDPA